MKININKLNEQITQYSMQSPSLQHNKIAFLSFTRYLYSLDQEQITLSQGLIYNFQDYLLETRSVSTVKKYMQFIRRFITDTYGLTLDYKVTTKEDK